LKASRRVLPSRADRGDRIRRAGDKPIDHGFLPA
jgi:hypothetical protein